MRRPGFLLLMLLLGGCRPAPTGAPAAATPAFDPGRVDGLQALAAARDFVAVGARVSGTPGATAGAAHIQQAIAAAGWRVLLDVFDSPTPAGSGMFANLLAVPPGLEGRTVAQVLEAAREPVVILASHYDTKGGIAPDFVGANDSGSSTGLLLHLASLLRQPGDAKLHVVLAFLDGEECARAYGPADGLHGSRRLAGQIAASPHRGRVRGVVVLDMIGDRDLAVRIPRNANRDLLAAVLRAAHREGVRQQFGISPRAIIDDHLPFLEAGIAAVDLIDFEYGSAPGLNDYWHTTNDTLDKLSADSLETVGRVTLRLLADMAGETSGSM